MLYDFNFGLFGYKCDQTLTINANSYRLKQLWGYLHFIESHFIE